MSEPRARHCAVCGKSNGAIAGFRTALGFFGYDRTQNGYAHAACIRRLQAKYFAKGLRACSHELTAASKRETRDARERGQKERGE